jgi:3-deoxy-D-manno-octulosonic-acid transferase
VTGPHTENFRDVVAAGEPLGVLTRVADRDELVAAICALLGDPPGLADRGARALRLVEENRGAAELTAELVLPLRDRAKKKRIAR